MKKLHFFTKRSLAVGIAAILAVFVSHFSSFAQSNAEITAFNFNLVPNYAETIDPANLTITVPVYHSADVANLVAVFTVSAGATVKVNDVAQTSGSSVNDFTNPVTYVVTSGDGSVTKNWVVTVTKNAALTDKQLLSFSFASIPGAVGVIDQNNHTVTVQVPHSQDVTALVATFTSSTLSRVYVGGVLQVSGTTPNDFTNTVTYQVMAENGSTRNYYVSITRAAARTEKEITAFSFQGLTPPVAGVIDQTAHTIALTVPYATDLTTLVATFTNSYLSKVKVGTIIQTSGVTANDFTNPVNYTVVAEDASTQDYVVTVTKAPASTLAQITTFKFSDKTPEIVGVIDQGAGTINLTIPYSQTKTGRIATFVKSEFSTVTVGGVTQVSGVTVNDFTTDKTYTVTAQDGTTTKTYVVHVDQTPASQANDILTFAFEKTHNNQLSVDANGVIDQTAKTIAVTVPFSTVVTALVATFTNSPLSTVKVNNLTQQSGVTPNNFTNPVAYTCVAEDGSAEIYTVTVTRAAPSQLNQLLTYKFEAAKNTALAADVNGVIDDPAKTVTLHVPYGTDVTALVATFTISPQATAKVNSVTQVSGTSANNFTNPVNYQIVAEDSSTEIYIVTVIIDPNTEKKILTYSFQGITPPATGTISNSTQTIQVNIPHSVSRLGLVATFTLSDHATAFVGGVQQVSGTTANDFDVVVTYVIQAQDGSTTTWQVTVTNNPVQTAKQITAYSFQALNPPVTGTIDQTALTIDLEVPYGTDVTALVATFTNSYLSTVDIGGVAQVSGTTANDFTNPVVYTVTAEDGSSNDYTVTVTIHPASSANDMLTFLFEAAKNAALTADAIGVIDQTARTINVEVPDETDRTALVATFTSSPITTVRVRSLGIQQSGVTINDFTNPVVYEVYAQDGTMKDYLVSVYESVDVTPPVVSNAAQTVSNLQGMFVVIRSNEDDGKVYIIKTGVAQSSVAQLEAAVAAGNGRSAYVTAADTDIPISTFNMTPGVYYAYAIDAAGNMSAKGTNAITIQDQMPPTVSVDAQTISNAPFNVVNIRSSDASGFVYLIIEGVPQANKAQLDAAVVANQGAKNFVIAANTDAPVSIAGLVPGNYHAYAVDMSNNMSNASANVVVITQASRLKSIMAYSFNQLNPPAIGQITGTEISVVVPVGTDVTNLVASFTLSPLSKAFVGLVEQVSGVSPNNFTTPVIYTVEAEDASTLDYQVTVSFNTGINDLPWSHQIRVYPNPFQDELITETPEPADRIEVVNVMGQVIDLINKPDATLIRWHTTSWEKGLYLIRVYKDGRLTAMEKLIK